MKPDGVQSHTIDINGMRICYYQAGQAGSPVVLLHGGGVDSAMISWSEIIPGLAAHHRVFAPDLPGYGRSDKPAVEYSLNFYIDFLGRFLDAMQLDTVSLAGISLGGGISLGFTLDFPERVERLILIDSYGLMPKILFHKLSYLYVHTPLNELSYRIMGLSRNLVRQTLTALIYDPKNITEDLLDEVYQAVRDPAAGRAFMSFQRSEVGWKGLRSDYSDRLGDLYTPTLILHGAEDISVPLKWVERAHARIKNSRLVVLKNRKHWPLRENPEEVIEILLEFLGDRDMV